MLGCSAMNLWTHVLKESQLDVFEAFYDGVGIAEQFRRMRIGHGEAFHAGTAGATDAFLGILDHHAVGGLDRFSISAAGVERGQRF